MIRITSKQEGFIRCRVVHPKGTVNYPDETFNERQIDQMRNEPKLKVEIIDDEILEDTEEEKSKPTGKKKRKGHSA